MSVPRLRSEHRIRSNVYVDRGWKRLRVDFGLSGERLLVPDSDGERTSEIGSFMPQADIGLPSMLAAVTQRNA